MAIISLSNVAGERTIAPLLFTPSAQQVAAFDFVRHQQGNALIEAVAGSGKTSTLVEICKLIQSGAIFLTFNKKISQEIAAKLAAAGLSDRDVKAATFHSVGFQAWARHAPKAVKNVKAEKLDILAEKIGMPKYLRFFAKSLVSLAKQSGIGIVTSMENDQPWVDLIEHFDLFDLIPVTDEELDEEEVLAAGLAWGFRLLRSSIAEADSLIDFDDMIYMPLYCNLKLWQYEWVLVDEAQDTNAMRREMARRLLRPGGRLIAVGDRHQAIYGFTGADADALDLIADTFQCQSLPLTVTYRCPQAVVALAQQWVPRIEAREGAPEGRVAHMEARAFVQVIPSPGDVIICRNTKPLVDLAFSYLKRRIPAAIEGRDIGRGLLTLSRKWHSAYSVRDLRVRLEEFLEHERERLLAQNKLHKFGAVEDKVQTLLVLADTFPDDTPLEEFRRVLESLFADSEPGQPQRKIILSTIHKAKGREWDRVWLYGRNTLMPSFYARQDWQLEQEDNLAYVAVTRAAGELIEVDLPGRKRGEAS
jgi:DNA helicase-2/ATP-dependent DNA helicase PcrA